VLLVSGAITWFTVYYSFQSKQAPVLTVQDHAIREGIRKESATVVTHHQKTSLPNYVVGEGLTEKHVAELNLLNKRIAIDELMSYLESQEKEE
jgi:hypothetical protein